MGREEMRREGQGKKVDEGKEKRDSSMKDLSQ
jgi:hypothetical protein